MFVEIESIKRGENGEVEVLDVRECDEEGCEDQCAIQFSGRRMQLVGDRISYMWSTSRTSYKERW